jgi:class 3 adenylate cyclase
MFCDLVGSTALSTTLDPEDYREILRAYRDAVSATIARHDGFIARYLGDGILAWLGFSAAESPTTGSLPKGSLTWPSKRQS